MLWKGRRESDNVEDRRSVSGGKLALGGGITAIIVIAFKLFFGGGIDVQDVANLVAGQSEPAQQMTDEEKQKQDDRAHFVKVVFADTEDVWKEIFSQYHKDYQLPSLVLFTGEVQSGCGNTGSEAGPFYCPADEKVYIDLTFYNDLRQKYGAKGGDFAQAYVIAHEVGHHVQNLLGISGKMDELRSRLSQEEYNKYSVCLELQADYFAGVWGHYEQGKGYLEKDDLEDALNAASVIGDDRLQRTMQGYVVPESFTHGASEQRMYWFKKGFESGDISGGDTFAFYRLSFN